MKLKRELGSVEGAEMQGDQPRPKRRKRGSSVATPSDVDMEEDSSEGDIAGLAERKTIAEQGMKIWKAVRNAKGKDDRLLSYDFMRLPPRRQYADYYTIIKHPICLEEIKVHLNGYEYRSLEAVKHEFDTCFKNAKKYNMKESQIWRDAKSLHKIATAQYKALSGTADDVDVMGSDDGSEDEDGKVRTGKPPNMYQLMKTRMDKLVAKTDNAGRPITDVFMELPSRKEWPSYYKAIKKLMCFSMINKRIRTKSYLNMGEFTTDVEQVFINAMTFNEEDSVIWADAVTLKEYFSQLMSDLPPSYALPEYNPSAQPQNGKLKLRVPAPSHVASSSNSTGLKVKLPALASVATPNTAQGSRTPQPQVKQPSRPPNTPVKPIPQAQPAQQQPPVQASSFLRPANFSQPKPLQPQPQYQYYSQTTSQPQSATQSISPSPLPPTPTPASVVYDHPLLSITVKTLPLGRTLRLDSSEGVRTWVLQLSKAESIVDLLDVRFEPSESDSEENEDGKDDDREDVFVKANGSVIDAKIPNKKEGEGVWEISDMKAGTNIVEVGEKDGEIWKIVLQRGVK